MKRTLIYVVAGVFALFAIGAIFSRLGQNVAPTDNAITNTAAR